MKISNCRNCASSTLIAAGSALLLFSSACDPAGPNDELTDGFQSPHYTFRWTPGDDTINAAWLELFHTWLTGQLGVEPAYRINYFKYKDVAQKQRLTGTFGNGIAFPDEHEVHTIWPNDNHEIVHVIVVSEFGRPIALFNEGIAVALAVDPPRNDLTPRWNGVPVATVARALIDAGNVPPLANLIRDDGSFRTYSENVTYPLAGAFVHSLIQQHGIAKMIELLQSSRHTDTILTTESKFEAVFGITFAAAWAQFISPQ